MDQRKQLEERAKRVGVTLASVAPSPPAAQDDPCGLMVGMRDVCLLDGAWIYPSPGEAEHVPGASRHYALRTGVAPAGGPGAPKVRAGWLRQTMPEAAALFDWMRTWTPEDVVRQIFANLWAGQGFIVDEGAGLAIGTVPRGEWLASEPNEQGLRRVCRRAGGQAR